MKKIEWTKKRKTVLIISIIASIAIVAGTLCAVFMFKGNNTVTKKIIKKKKVVVMNNDVVDNVSGDDSIDVVDSDDDSVIIKIIKRIERVFNNDEEDEDYVRYSNSNYKTKTLYAKNFGVKGDGVTDDGEAIFEAVMALHNCGPGSKLIFENNKKYYVKKLDLQLFNLTGVEGLTIDGGNGLFILDKKTEYLNVSDTKDCIVKNMKFDYANKPAFTAEFVSLDLSTSSAVMKADRDIGLDDKEIYTAPSSWFGVVNKNDTRRHLYISRYEMISKRDRTFKVYFTSDINTQNFIKLDVFRENGMICPMPEMGHLQERAATVRSNLDLKLDNIKIHSACRFGMLICQNEGTLTMNGVDFVPADNPLDKNMIFTSWRDAFHCKDNRCAVNWNNCKAIGNYDDIYNISSSTLCVTDYNIAKNRITLEWPEAKGGEYYKIKPGDILNVIDTDVGEDCGTAKVKRVVSQSGGKNIVVLEKPLDNLMSTGTSVLAFFTNLCAPNSTINNCNFNGTFRFRGPISITNSYFYNQRTWIDLYTTLEGPIPKNITFKNCNIENGSGGTFIIGANSGNTDKLGYHVEKIKFESCTMDSGSLRIYDSDKDYVTLKNCKEPDGTAINNIN